MNLQQIVLLAATTATAMVAGLLYAYSCSVNPGLGKLDDAGYVAAMQSINRAIQNPLFFVSFMGALLLLPLCGWIYRAYPNPAVFWLIVSAAAVYMLGVFIVTMFFNVPLNQALEQFRLTAAPPDTITQQRSSFEVPWNRWHAVRTVSAFVSTVLMIVACIKQ